MFTLALFALVLTFSLTREQINQLSHAGGGGMVAGSFKLRFVNQFTGAAIVAQLWIPWPGGAPAA